MSSSNTETVPLRFTGRVKWFNNKTGYGFISVTSKDSGEFHNLDVFVHHSAVIVSGQQYKYLVQGEYVEFELSEMTSGQHKYQVLNVTGIDGGKLMCETRNENKEPRDEHRESRGEPRSEYRQREPRREEREPRGEPRSEHHQVRDYREREPRPVREESRGRGGGGRGREGGRGRGRGVPQSMDV